MLIYALMQVMRPAEVTQSGTFGDCETSRMGELALTRTGSDTRSTRTRHPVEDAAQSRALGAVKK
jgi:hypothetical protein